MELYRPDIHDGRRPPDNGGFLRDPGLGTNCTLIPVFTERSFTKRGGKVKMAAFGLRQKSITQ